MSVVDLYAGPGGWDIAARTLDINPVGIERDGDTCRTRSAAGLSTIQADLLEFPPDAVNVGQLDGLIASPPCPAFSAAGDGRGRAALPELCHALDTVGAESLGMEAHAAIDSDPEVEALVQPVAWLLHHRPRWAAFEQVPPVLPFWEAVARWLDSEGWHTWTGIVNAADYGVPQTRRRAILLANRDRPVSAPTPTHSEFPQPSLFGGDDPDPWVSMADALGLPGGMLDQYRRDGDQREPHRPPVEVSRPAPTITTKANRWEWTTRRPATTVQGDSRIWPPGHKINQDDIDRLGETEARARYGDKVTPAEAATLQTFPYRYPFQGSKSSQAKQIGNAVPPLLARHLLAEATR